ncbi:MAG: hypothetical protein AcusKO_03030 [Acuticoccus sp.]
MPEWKFICEEEVKGYTGKTGGKTSAHLLWGDRVEVVEEGSPRTKVRGRGRNREFWVDSGALEGKALLEIYFIDVGQGGRHPDCNARTQACPNRWGVPSSPAEYWQECGGLCRLEVFSRLWGGHDSAGCHDGLAQ